MSPVQVMNDRDIIQSEPGFDLLKKKKTSYKHARKYQQLLDADYPGNKIVITAYQNGLLKTVQQLMINKKKEGTKKSGSATNEKQSQLPGDLNSKYNRRQS